MRTHALRTAVLIVIGVTLSTAACASGSSGSISSSASSGTSGGHLDAAGVLVTSPGLPGPGPSVTAGPAPSGTGSAVSTSVAAAPRKDSSPKKATSAPLAAGWKQVYREDFGGSKLPRGWITYSGAISSSPGAEWAASQVSLSGGAMHLATSNAGGQWYSGGVMNGVQAQRTYGKYEVRFRIQRAAGVKYVLLLWPKSQRWPVDGEIDFAEDRGGNRGTSTAAVHWGSTNEIMRKDRTSDFSQWHTAGVEWTPGQVVFTLDGAKYSTMKTVHAPKTPMNLALQTESNPRCGTWMSCISSATPARTTMDIDWVRVSERT